MRTHLTQKIWAGSTAGGISLGLISWAAVVGSVPNSWFRKDSTGVAQWMGWQTLKQFLWEPLVMSIYWTHRTMLLHNLYFMLLFGLFLGAALGGITIAALSNRDDLHRN